MVKNIFQEIDVKKEPELLAKMQTFQIWLNTKIKELQKNYTTTKDTLTNISKEVENIKASVKPLKDIKANIENGASLVLMSHSTFIPFRHKGRRSP